MKRLSSAHAISVIAMFIALGGTGYAAATITSSQVKDGSLTGRDVRDRSLTGRDIRDRSLRATDFAAGQLPAGRAGEQGPAGPQGAAGPQGERGPAGASGTRRSFVGQDRKAVRMTTAFNPARVVGGQVPAGAYVMTASGTFDNDNTGSVGVNCRLVLGDEVIADLGEIRIAGQNNAADKVPFSLTGAATSPGVGDAELRCNISTNGTPNATVVNPSLTIVATDELSTLDTD